MENEIERARGSKEARGERLFEADGAKTQPFLPRRRHQAPSAKLAILKTEVPGPLRVRQTTIKTVSPGTRRKKYVQNQ